MFLKSAEILVVLGGRRELQNDQSRILEWA